MASVLNQPFFQNEEAAYAKLESIVCTLGYDEDEAAFDEKLKVIARQKPKAEPKRHEG